MKISSVLNKVNEEFTVMMCDNGFVITASGEDLKTNWRSVKVICDDLEELNVAIADISSIPKT